MGKGRPRICPLCKEVVTKEESFEYKGRYYHESCFVKFSKKTTKEKVKKKKEKQKIEKVKKEIQQDTHIALEIDISDEEILAKEKVISYLKELLNTNKLGVKIYKLLKDYYNTYKFSYKGMLITLKYFYEIQENPVVSDCVGIIPYVYEEAQEYEKTKTSVKKQLEKLNLENIVTSKVIKIKKPKNNINKLIDIEELR
ncbi:MAG: hypothetical protein ACOYI4_01830 [Christensenellales bacterium]|jgi:hypothetical protein